MPALKFAVPKGRPLEAMRTLLLSIGVHPATLEDDSRRLLVNDPGTGMQFILAKPVDVPTYVEYGAADLGVVGKDTLLEHGAGLAELLDLRLARCSFVVAVAKDSGITDVRQLGFNCRVATKYPHVATAYFNSLGLPVEIVPLNGSIELAPIVGLAEAIVDITETGRTLQENGLQVVATIAHSSLRLVANRVSYKVEHAAIQSLIAALGRHIQPPTEG